MAAQTAAAGAAGGMLGTLKQASDKLTCRLEHWQLACTRLCRSQLAYRCRSSCQQHDAPAGAHASADHNAGSPDAAQALPGPVTVPEQQVWTPVICIRAPAYKRSHGIWLCRTSFGRGTVSSDALSLGLGQEHWEIVPERIVVQRQEDGQLRKLGAGAFGKVLPGMVSTWRSGTRRT